MKKILNVWEVWDKINKGETDFRGADLTDMNLAGVNFMLTNLTGAKLVCTNCTMANFSGADLTDVDSTDANLTGADLDGVRLSANSGIKTFQGKYFAFFHQGAAYPYGHLLQVGCKSYYDIDDRIKKHTEISDRFKYSEAERVEMFEFIRSLKTNLKKELKMKENTVIQDGFDRYLLVVYAKHPDYYCFSPAIEEDGEPGCVIVLNKDYIEAEYVIVYSAEIQATLIKKYNLTLLEVNSPPRCCFYKTGWSAMKTLVTPRHLEHVIKTCDHDFWECKGFIWPAYPGEPERKNKPTSVMDFIIDEG